VRYLTGNAPATSGGGRAAAIDLGMIGGSLLGKYQDRVGRVTSGGLAVVRVAINNTALLKRRILEVRVAAGAGAGAAAAAAAAAAPSCGEQTQKLASRLWPKYSVETNMPRVQTSDSRRAG